MNRPQHPSEYYRVGPLPIELFLPPDPDYCDLVTLPPDQPVVWDEPRLAEDIPGLLIEAMTALAELRDRLRGMVVEDPVRLRKV